MGSGHDLGQGSSFSIDGNLSIESQTGISQLLILPAGVGVQNEGFSLEVDTVVFPIVKPFYCSNPLSSYKLWDYFLQLLVGLFSKGKLTRV